MLKQWNDYLDRFKSATDIFKKGRRPEGDACRADIHRRL
jgi:hypothetical protein